MTRPTGAALGLFAAALWGVSAPFSKLLLGHVEPLPLAALLYLGSGALLGVARAGQALRRRPGRSVAEARIRRGDLGLLVAVVLLGGVAGPLLLLVGLARLSAVAGALLLNLETPFTILLAVLLFREYLGRRGMLAAALVVAGALLLGLRGDVAGDWVGVAAIAGACLAWAMDNNLTQRLSLRDPIAVVLVKSWGAGTLMLLVSLALDVRLPSVPVAVAALALGGVSYGVSLVLYVRALRVLGAARQAAYFATAPFIGALVAVPLLGDSLGAGVLAAGALMALGVSLLLGERHAHRHVHEILEHDHVHVTDAHHQHSHEGLDVGPEPHAHPHRHEHLEHVHAHVSDVHHRHRHG